MRLKVLSIPLLSAALLSTDVSAYEENHLNTCYLSEPAQNNYEPAEFSMSNNLLRPPGMKEIYCGEKILLKIRILDQACVPISDAKLYIWQVGCDGKYPYKPLRKLVDKKFINTKSRSTFVGHGTATSDNLGNANFLTIYPPSKEHDFINLRIVHRNYGEFQTKIEITENMVKKAQDHDVVETTITLPWENIRRSY